MSDTAGALHAIRVAELEAARRVEQARADVADRLADARRVRAGTVDDAVERGQAEARRRFEAVLAAAEREAGSILAGCDARVDALRRAAEPHLASAATQMVDLLLAPPLEEGK